MNVLLIGGGGREHAIAWKLRQSPLLTDLHVAPGNAGTDAIAHNVALPVPRTGSAQADVDAYLDAAVQQARELKVDLVFVAPDDPLAWGLVDKLSAAGIAAFGPTAAAAQLEASKAWAKQLMERHGIPHTRTLVFDDPAAAREYVQHAVTDVVVKADGLAAGKGAIVTSSKEEALQAIDELAALGEAGRRLTIEERIHAREVSAHAFSDGKTIAAMPLSCDHKSVFDGGVGPNTGGMGVYSPPWWAAPSLEGEIAQQVLQPLADAMRAEGRPFSGIIYPGVFALDGDAGGSGVAGRASLSNQSAGGLQVFECNARFGDPETQALLTRLDSDLLEIVWACVNGRLHEVKVEWSTAASVCVVLASGGYPGDYAMGFPITGFDTLDADVQAFHAGTHRGENGDILTAGGRVLGITATAPTLAEARARAYANVERVHFEGMHYRTDIGTI